MILRNPHNQDVSLVIGGNEYSIEADGVVEVPETVGRAWLKIHQFLVEEEVEAKVEAEVVQEPKAEEVVIAPTAIVAEETAPQATAKKVVKAKAKTK